MRGHFSLAVVLAVAGCAAPSARAPSVGASYGNPVSRDLPLERPSVSARPAEATSLVGLYARDIETLLGRPRFVRKDGPAQIWQYGVETCTLNLFLFRENVGYKVRHLEFRHPGAELGPGGCDAASSAAIVQTKR